MQAIFSLGEVNDEDNKKGASFLLGSMNGMYDLYLAQLALLISIHKKSIDQLKISQQKKLATEEDRNPNLKFVNNIILKSLSENKLLNETIDKKNLNFWDLDFEYVDLIFKDILKSKTYQDYMSDTNSDLHDDKFFMVDIFTEVIAPNDKLYDYFEDKRLTWTDDISVVNTYIVKAFKKFKPNKPVQYFLPDLFKDEEDLEFGKDLYRKTIEHKADLHEEIAKRTKNWDADRLASIDGILLQMAICELQQFSSIPVKVTINEYLEIAKEYSTPKSSIFINGVLDKLVKEYRAQNMYPKSGRGLM